VLVRYFTNSSFAWTEEISVFLMIVPWPWSAGSAAVARDQHIRIDSLPRAARALRSKRLASWARPWWRCCLA
jgi:TRAP-type C4-dicarboxylate transport system permease small subunit